jgi:hypothetical protein
VQGWSPGGREVSTDNLIVIAVVIILVVIVLNFLGIVPIF